MPYFNEDFDKYPAGTPYEHVFDEERKMREVVESNLDSRLQVVESRLLILSEYPSLAERYPGLKEAYDKFKEEEEKMLTFEALKRDNGNND